MSYLKSGEKSRRFDFVSWIPVKCLWTEELWTVPVALACGYGSSGVLCKVSGGD